MPKLFRRVLSLILALAVGFTYFPIYSFADESETTSPSENISLTDTVTPDLEVNCTEKETSTDLISSDKSTDFISSNGSATTDHAQPEKTNESSDLPSQNEDTEAEKLLKTYQQRIDSILKTYLKNDEKTAEEIIAVVEKMDWETYQTARWEISLLADDVNANCASGVLSEEQCSVLLERNITLTYFYEALENRYRNDNTVSVYTSMSGSVCTSVGVSASWSKAVFGNTRYGGCDISDNTITAWATHNALSWTQTTQITLKNNFATDMVFALTWSALNHSSIKINDQDVPASSSQKYTVTAGSSLTIKLGSNYTDTRSTLTIDVSTEVPADEFSVTLVYDSNLGSVTSSDTEIVNNQMTVTKNGFTLTATAKNGSVFLGWVDSANGQILNSGATNKFTVSTDITIQAVFAHEEYPAWFLVDNAYFFNDLHTAATKGKTIVLAHHGVLNGAHTIPSGVTLLIPFDDANTVCTTSPPNSNTYTTPSAYRTLTMESNAKITVDGTISVAATVCAQSGGRRGAGSPTGKYGLIKMNSGSSITVNNGGNLYVYGFITGTGSVLAKSGATLYECFQFEDFRGGSMLDFMTNNSTNKAKRVFPLSQYYIQSIEVPLTIEYGAVEYGYSAVKVSIVQDGIPISFIGKSGCMFNLTSGSLTKTYDGTKDRLNVEVNGNLTVSNITIKKTILGQGINLNSTDYDLPLNNNMTVQINSGSNVAFSQNMALLPGSQIILKEGATCTLESGVSVFVYDLEEWGGYCASSNKKFLPVQHAPGRTYNRTDSDLADAFVQVDGLFDASAGYIYTTAGRANIHSTGKGVMKTAPGTQAATYQVVQNATAENSTYAEIPITPAQLKNEDASYVATADGTTNTSTYYYGHGVWHKNEEHKESSVTTTPEQTKAGYITKSCPCGYSNREDIYAAEVGEDKYKILDDAFTAVTSGGTVNLLSSIDGNVTVSKPMTINKGGKEISLTVGDGYSFKDENDIITIWQLIRIAGTSVKAGDSLDIYFYVSGLTGNDYKAEIVREKDGAKLDPIYVNAESWEDYSGMRRFCYQDIAAKEMTDIVSVTILDSENYQISTTFDESIEGYAIRTMNYSGNDGKNNLKTALVDMLNYGAAAQNNWNYRVTVNGEDNLANRQLTDTQKASASSATYTNTTVNNDLNTADNYKLAGATLTAESNLFFTFYFNGITEANKDSFSADITFKGNTITIPGTDFVAYDSTKDSTPYGPCLTGLAIADGHRPIVCSLKLNGEEIINVTSNVESYIAATVADTDKSETLITLCRELKDFIESARTYFSNPNA